MNDLLQRDKSTLNDETKSKSGAYSISTHDRVIQNLLHETSESTLEWHKELLFGLFLKSDEDELASLCTKSKYTDRTSIQADKKSRFAENDKLSLLPDLVHTFSKNRTSISSLPISSGMFPVTYRRKDYKSCSQQQLKQEIASKFMKNTFPSAATGCRYLQQSTLSSQKGFTKSDKSQTLNGLINEHCEGFKPFQLLFNECSLGAIATWVSHDQQKDTNNSNRNVCLYQPVPAPSLRLCKICKKWGHYDSECEEIKENDIIQLANQTMTQRHPGHQDVRQNVKGKWVDLSHSFNRKGHSLFTDNEKLPRLAVSGKEPTSENVTAVEVPVTVCFEHDKVCPICEANYSSRDRFNCSNCGKVFQHSCQDTNGLMHEKTLCNLCCAYDSDVSSVAELEGCEDFVIEQYKRPSSCDRPPHLPNQGWRAAAFISQSHNDDDNETRSVRTYSEAQSSETLNVAQIDIDRIKFTSTFHMKPMSSTEVICLDALSISGYKKIKPSFGKKINFCERGSVYGLRSRPIDGALPAFSSPSIKCMKCSGYFPSHVLTDIFYPQSVVSDSLRIFVPPTSAQYPSLPWGISKLVSFTCGNCMSNNKGCVEGKVIIKARVKPNMKDRIQIALVNLVILANPTHISRTSYPAILQDSRNKSPNRNTKHHLYFSLDDIFNFLMERAEFFHFPISTTKKIRLQTKKQIYDGLRRMIKSNLVASVMGEDKIVYYAITGKGFFHEALLSIETLPQHVYSIMDKYPTKPTIRATSIIKTYPETIISWNKKQENQHREKAKNTFKKAVSNKHTNFATSSANEDRAMPNMDLSEWDDMDITDDNEIVIFSRRDRKNQAVEKDTIATELGSKAGTTSKHNSSQVKNTPQFQVEYDTENIRFLQMSPSEQLKGATVAWKITQNKLHALGTDLQVKESKKYVFGTVVSKAQNGVVLVQIISNFENAILSAITKIQRAGSSTEQKEIQIDSFCLGASFWIPIARLNLVTRAPSSRRKKKTKNESTRKAPNKKQDEISTTDVPTNPTSQPISHVQRNGKGKKRKSVASTTQIVGISKKPSIELNEEEIDEIAIHNSSSKATTAGIFQAEKILGEKQARVGNILTTIYLIKWKGFGNDDNTWEPERNILNPTLVSAYRTNQFTDKLKVTKEAKNVNSPSYRTLSLLRNLHSELTVGYAKPRSHSKSRTCPFCQQQFKDGYGLGGHIRSHSESPNYNLIREAHKFIESEGLHV